MPFWDGNPGKLSLNVLNDQKCLFLVLDNKVVKKAFKVLVHPKIKILSLFQTLFWRHVKKIFSRLWCYFLFYTMNVKRDWGVCNILSKTVTGKEYKEIYEESYSLTFGYILACCDQLVDKLFSRPTQPSCSITTKSNRTIMYCFQMSTTGWQKLTESTNLSSCC